MKSFAITSDDLSFVNQQVSIPVIRVVRYLSDGTEIYGYTDPNNSTVVELGVLGSFNLMDTAWAAFIPNTTLITNTNSSPFGIRDVGGLFNNLTLPSSADWGSTNLAFSRNSNSDYSRYVHQSVSDEAFKSRIKSDTAVQAQVDALSATSWQQLTLDQKKLVQDSTWNMSVAADGSVDLAARYSNPFLTVWDYTPRLISQTVHSQTALERMDDASGGNVITDHASYQLTDLVTGEKTTVQENFVRNLNTLAGDPSLTGWSVLFGQFFDHGLDFIGKGGNTVGGVSSKIYIPLDPSDPLYDPANGVTRLSLSRATVGNPQAAGADGMFRTADDIQSPGADGQYGTADDVIGPVNPEYSNHTSPYIDQSQTYGSSETLTNLLRHWVWDAASGKYIAGMRLYDGTTLAAAYDRQNPDGSITQTKDTLPTLNELRKHVVTTGRDDIAWSDISNLRVRDAQGRVLDLDPATPGVQAAFTDHMLIADMLPRLDVAHVLTDPLAGVAGHVNPLSMLVGVTRSGDTASAPGSYVDDYLDVNTGAPTALGLANPEIVGEIMLRAIGDHYVAGDGRINENFGLTAVHHVWHENHNWQIDNLIEAIKTAQADDPTHTAAWAWQVPTAFVDAAGNYTVGAGGPISWNQEKLFQAAVLINQTEYQHVAIDQYARGLTPNIPLFFMYDTSVNADVSLEYSQAAFRFGHSQLRETIDALDPKGSLVAAVTHYALEQAFLNPAGFAKVGPTAIALGMTRQVASELDEILTPALQQKLLGQPQDLAALNIARGRDLGLPTLNELRKALAGGMLTELRELQDKLIANPGDVQLQQAIDKTIALHASLQPYTSWDDFGNALAHPEALASFLAAYTFNGNLDAAQAILDLANGAKLVGDLSAQILGVLEATLGLGAGELTDLNAAPLAADFLGPQGDQHYENIDAWSGGIAEKHVFLGQMGPTFDVIFCDQMTRLINGDRFYYFWRLQDGLISVTHLISSVVTEQFSDIIERTTGAKHLPGDVMFMVDSFVELSEQYAPQLAANNMGVRSVYGVSTALNGQAISSGGVTYIRDNRPNSSILNPDGTPSAGFNSHEVIGGTDRRDWIDAGDGDDTVYLGAGDDVGLGGAGADHLYGEAGNDTLDGGQLPDFIDGGSGNDVIHGGDDADVLIGSDGNDRLYGDTLIDEAHGDAGDDYVDGGSEGDFLFGGTGSDVVTGGEGVDVVDGEWGDDVLFGGAGPDQLFGGFGDDIMHGGDGAGNLTLNVDETLGEVGFDMVSFSELPKALDVVADMNFQNINQVGPQTSLVTPFGQLWVLIEGVEGGSFADQIIGDAQGNWLIGGGNDDIISGGVGDDVIVGDSVRLDKLIGTLSNGVLGTGLLDQVAAGGGKHFADLLRANPNFTFGMNAFVSTTDVIYSASTAGVSDIATYAGGFAAFKFYPVFDPVTSNNIVALRIVDTRGVESTAIGDLAIGIEKFVFGFDFETTVTTGLNPHKYINPTSLLGYTSFDYNTLTRNPLPTAQYKVTGYASENSAKPLASSIGLTNPVNVLTCDLVPIFSAFHITTYSFQWQVKAPNSASWVNISGKTGTSLSFIPGLYAQGSQFRQVVTFQEINNGPVRVAYSDPSAPMGKQLIGTSTADNLKATAYQDAMYGSAGNDSMLAYAGDDYLNGGDGNDTLDGGLGVDQMLGGSGNDIYVVDNPMDVVSEALAQGVDLVQSSVSYALTAEVENLTLTGTALITGTGNGLNNILTGNAASNSLDGGIGNDTLNGAAGGDAMTGGVGDDVYVVDDISDITIENPNEGLDSVQSSITWLLADNLENLTLTGTGNINASGNFVNNVLTGNGGNNSIFGDDGNDSILGGAGNDTLDGGLGNDTLTAGAGRDVLTGGAGSDVFYYASVADIGRGTAQDRITDATLGVDKIDLSAIDANTLLAGDQAFTFIGGAAFSGAGQIRYVNGILSGDTNGDLAADFELTLVGTPAISVDLFTL